MAILKSEAIVLKVQNFRETSLIVRFFTRDFGKISGIIKGIRKEPARYGGIPLTFSLNSIVFYGSIGKNLNLISQCDIADQFSAIRSDLQKTNYANYFIELLDAVTFEYDKNEHLFELVISCLGVLYGAQQCRQLARIFEIKLLNISGFKPRLDTCVSCQQKIPAQAKFSLVSGGILCPRCYVKDSSASAVMKGTLASLEYIEKVPVEKALQLKMTANIESELTVILSRFIRLHLDKEIKSQKLLN
ncbi:MAG: DNA repair protein RecO [Candidatus Omnitrophota bacterium]